MEEGILSLICLADIAPSKHNSRTVFDGEAYDQLRESIRTKGVLVPILVRPVEGAKKPFEIVFGERRFKASCDLAKVNGGVKKHDIQAIVKSMTDDEAFDAMQIENLQREDLTPLEQARGYAKYLAGKDDSAVADLAARISTSPHRIRRVVRVLELPANIVEAWDKGKIAFGHLEQYIRLDTAEDQQEVFVATTQGWNKLTVTQLRNHIDQRVVSLDTVLFDKTECAMCPKNTACQKSLFGEEISDSVGCTDQKCFAKKQADHITANWETIKADLKVKTKGFMFSKDASYDIRKMMSKLPKQCKECDSGVTILNLDGSVFVRNPICMGDAKCFKNIHETPAKTEGEETKPEETNTPRVDWHGECFREIFYKEAIPKAWELVPSDFYQATNLRLMVLALALRDHSISRRIAPGPQYGDPTLTLMPFLETLSEVELMRIMHEVVMDPIMDLGKTLPGIRHQVAQHLGLELQTDFRITPLYLKKKTSQEIRKLITDLGFDRDENFLKCLTAMGKDMIAIGTLKKSQLIHLIIGSGADLAGKAPQEILDVKLETISQIFKYKKIIEEPTKAEAAGEGDDPEEGGQPAEAGLND